jgi:hypothetical protein
MKLLGVASKPHARKHVGVTTLDRFSKDGVYMDLTRSRPNTLATFHALASGASPRRSHMGDIGPPLGSDHGRPLLPSRRRSCPRRPALANAQDGSTARAHDRRGNWHILAQSHGRTSADVIPGRDAARWLPGVSNRRNRACRSALPYRARAVPSWTDVQIGHAAETLTYCARQRAVAQVP